MALQSSGAIKISQIKSEKSESFNSLTTLSTNNINQNSASKPDGNTPHSMSEFYSYDHTYNPGPPPVTYYDGVISSEGLRDHYEVCMALEPTVQIHKTGSSNVPGVFDEIWIDGPQQRPFGIRDGGWYLYFLPETGTLYKVYLLPGDVTAIIESVLNCE